MHLASKDLVCDHISFQMFSFQEVSVKEVRRGHISIYEESKVPINDV